MSKVSKGRVCPSLPLVDSGIISTAGVWNTAGNQDTRRTPLTVATLNSSTSHSYTSRKNASIPRIAFLPARQGGTCNVCLDVLSTSKKSFTH